MSPLEQIPSMVKLDTSQLRKVVLLIFGAESMERVVVPKIAAAPMAPATKSRTVELRANMR